MLSKNTMVERKEETKKQANRSKFSNRHLAIDTIDTIDGHVMNSCQKLSISLSLPVVPNKQ